MPIRLAIGCHSYLLGEGLGKLLDGETGIDIIGIFSEGMNFKEIMEMNPDVLLLDGDIFRDLQRNFMINNKIKILLAGNVTRYSGSDGLMADLISRGVVGILPSVSDSHLLKRAVKAISSGELWLDRKMMRNILLSRNGEVRLTKTEQAVASFICQGYRNKEIAKRLNISEQTVKAHCNRIYKKVGVSDRLQLAIYIYRQRPNWYHARD